MIWHKLNIICAHNANFLFCVQVNDWFDALNVRVPYSDSRERVHALGLTEDVQLKILDDMSDTMQKLRVKETEKPKDMKGTKRKRRAISER